MGRNMEEKVVLGLVGGILIPRFLVPTQRANQGSYIPSLSFPFFPLGQISIFHGEEKLRNLVSPLQTLS